MILAQLFDCTALLILYEDKDVVNVGRRLEGIVARGYSGRYIRLLEDSQKEGLPVKVITFSILLVPVRHLHGLT